LSALIFAGQNDAALAAVRAHLGEWPRVLQIFKSQREAIDWAKSEGHHPLVARVRHLNDKKVPDHWRAARRR
jgi:hypothetical protein